LGRPWNAAESPHRQTCKLSLTLSESTTRDGLRLASRTPSALRKMRRQNFDCDRTFQPRIPHSVHLTNPARAQQRLNLVWPKFCTRSQQHTGPHYSAWELCRTLSRITRSVRRRAATSKRACMECCGQLASTKQIRSCSKAALSGKNEHCRRKAIHWAVR
jgi:hypothetical protein